MFGTMVVCLPSVHECGDLVLKFGGRAQKYSSSDGSTWRGSFFAWYSDVLHEVRIVNVSRPGPLLT
jgi:hypothetical protein